MSRELPCRVNYIFDKSYFNPNVSVTRSLVLASAVRECPDDSPESLRGAGPARGVPLALAVHVPLGFRFWAGLVRTSLKSARGELPGPRGGFLVESLGESEPDYYYSPNLKSSQAPSPSHWPADGSDPDSEVTSRLEVVT